MKKVLLMCVSMLLVAALSIGGTLAYLTSTDSAVNVMTVGNVQIELIEQQRDGNGKLEKFEDGKALLPIVGSAQLDVKDDYGLTTAKNYVDKIVSVENTGRSDAYVRVLVAIPAALEAPAASENILHWNTGTKFAPKGDNVIPATQYTWKPLTSVTINGAEHNVYAFYYNGILASGDTTTAAFVGFYLDSRVDNEIDASGNVVYTFDGKPINYDLYNGVVIPVYAQAVQAAGFKDAETAFATAKMTDNPWANFVTVSNDAGLKAALTADEAEIVVDLTGDVTYDVAAWANNAMGGASTKNIVINGNGYTITFNQTNSDWNNIVTANGATLTINDATITNSGHNDGPWNRHDLTFGCDVVLNNVVSDKALAFKAGATLKNVTIDDANTGDTYAIWICPNGQTITIDGLTIDMIDCTDGRGIKIDNQYIDDTEKKVTLKVSNATFKTEEKAAILVKSTVGADITLSNVDISGVKADTTNAVWVDEKSAEYYDLVTVTGGSKVQEK